MSGDYQRCPVQTITRCNRLPRRLPAYTVAHLTCKSKLSLDASHGCRVYSCFVHLIRLIWRVVRLVPPVPEPDAFMRVPPFVVRSGPLSTGSDSPPSSLWLASPTAASSIRAGHPARKRMTSTGQSGAGPCLPKVPHQLCRALEHALAPVRPLRHAGARVEHLVRPRHVNVPAPLASVRRPPPAGSRPEGQARDSA